MPLPPRLSPMPPVSSQLQLPTQSEDFSILLSRLQVAHEDQVANLQSQIEVLNDLLKNKTTESAVSLSPLVLCTPVADAYAFDSDSNSPPAENLRLSKSQSQASVGVHSPDASGAKLELPKSQSQESVGLDVPNTNGGEIGLVNAKSKSFQSILSPTLNLAPSMTVIAHESYRNSLFSVEVFPALHVQSNRQKQKMVDSPHFEVLSLLVVFLNTITMLVQAQYEGIDVAYSLDVDGYSKSKDDAWPSMGKVLEVAERCFICFFTFELLLRIQAHRLQFFKGCYHVMDCLIVLAGWLDWAAGDSFDPTMLRLLRLVRIGRIFRSFSNPRFLDALYFLTSSIKSSMSTLMWSLVVLLIIQCIAALTICQLLYVWFEDAPQSPESRQVFYYYGNFTRAILTMFEILLANWIVPCRVLSDHVGEYAGLLILSYRCICGFAVLNVISAVFINQTMKSMSQDSDVMLIERSRVEQKFKSSLIRLFKLLDMSNDGKITRDELRTRLMDPDVHLACFNMGMSIHDLEGIIDLCEVDDEEGMEVELFIRAAHDIRKQANNLDMARLLVHSRHVDHHVKRIRQDFRKMSDLVQKSFDKMVAFQELPRRQSSAAHFATLPGKTKK